MPLNERDRISDALVCALTATFGSTILAVPWYGFGPLLIASAGLVASAYAFKTVRELIENDSRKRP